MGLKYPIMDKQYMFDFLADLSANNSKEWMDEHRPRYLNAKNIWLDEIQLILDRLSQHDRIFEHVQAKKTVSRINNNRQFHKDRPIYKDYFTCMPRGSEQKPAFMISVGPNNSFIGGGFHRPDNEVLARIRGAIDYNGEELKAILTTPKFMQYFNGLDEDPQQLKTKPKGYSVEHPHIDLLRRKNFTSIIHLSPKEVVSDNFVDTVEQSYIVLKPFLDYLEQAVSVEASVG